MHLTSHVEVYQLTLEVIVVNVKVCLPMFQDVIRFLLQSSYKHVKPLAEDVHPIQLGETEDIISGHCVQQLGQLFQSVQYIFVWWGKKNMYFSHNQTN